MADFLYLRLTVLFFALTYELLVVFEQLTQARGLSDEAVKNLVNQYAEGRQFGFLGEPRVNVLELNLPLDGLK